MWVSWGPAYPPSLPSQPSALHLFVEWNTNFLINASQDKSINRRKSVPVGESLLLLEVRLFPTRSREGKWSIQRWMRMPGLQEWACVKLLGFEKEQTWLIFKIQPQTPSVNTDAAVDSTRQYLERPPKSWLTILLRGTLKPQRRLIWRNWHMGFHFP